MKRIYSFMVAAVAMFAAAACTQELENVEPEVKGETVVYTASTDGADTKAVLNETTKKSEWVADDAITVHDGNIGYTYVADAAGPVANFSAQGNGFDSYSRVLAVYPAGTYTADVAEKKVKAYIPTWQQAQAGTYHSPAALAVAYTEDNTFAFKNAHALLKFTVNTDNVTHVIFHGNGSEAITGDVNVTLGEEGVESVECLETVFTSEKWNDETQQNEQVSETKYGTWVECYAYHDDANKYFAKDQTYYIAVAPQKFDGGVTVRVKIDGGEELVAKTTTNPVETKINTILNLGEIKYKAPATVEKVYLQPGVWSADGAWFSAHFFNSVGGAEDVEMTDEDADGVYEVSVPAGMESVIFCRMDPAYSDFAWDHVWTEMSSVAIPLAGDTKVYYNVTDWEAGEWSDTPQESTPDQPEIESSGWSLPGGYNDWNTTDTYLYEEGDYYVAKNVSGLDTGFKFQHEEFGWKGVGSTAPVAVGEWHKLNGESNISLPDAKAYDIYMTKDGSQFQAVVAGSAAPEAPVVVPDYWGLIGTMAGSAWGTDLVLTEEGDYLVYKGVTLTTSDEFKFHKNGEWNDQKIAKGGLAAANTEYDLVDSGQANMKVSTAGTYDIYVKKDISKVYFMETGKTPDQAVQPDLSNTYRFYVQNNVGWSTLNFYAWDASDGYKSAGWPGDSMTSVETVDGYGTCKYIEIPKGVSVVNFIVNDGSKQTNDLTVNNNSNVKTLANGDMIYILTDSDIKK